MLNEFQILLVLVFALDIFFTYFNIYNYKKLFPNKDSIKLEVNPILKFAFKFGLVGKIMAVALFILLLNLLIIFADIPSTCIIVGMYLMVIFYHISNALELKEESDKRKGKKKKSNLRTYIFILFCILSMADLCTTFIYISTYHNWQPNKPFNLMEQNPLLLFLWNNLGLVLGTIVGQLIILTILGIVAYKTTGAWGWIIIVLISLALTFGIVNNILNMNILKDYITRYPTGVING